jgi:hypothetical protein
VADFNNGYASGLKNCYVKDSSGKTYDVDTISDITATNSQHDVQIKGDDQIKTIFSSERVETLKIMANAISFDALAAMTGNTVSSSASGMDIPFGTDSEMNPPFVEVGGQINGRLKDGTPVVIEKRWHKVQLGNIHVNMKSETEFSLEADGTAFQTDKDVVGAALSPARTSTVHEYAGQVS